MNNKIYRVIMFSFLMLMYSCSSDPCEDIACNNGSCNEGICECATGWKGPTCSEIDYNFVGEYRSSSISVFACPASEDNATRSTNADHEVCVVDNDVTTCLSVLLRLEEDMTYFFNIIISETNGTVTTGNPTVIRGDYTMSNNRISLCDSNGDCTEMTLDMDQMILTWTQVESTAAACGISWELSRQ